MDQLSTVAQNVLRYVALGYDNKFICDRTHLLPTRVNDAMREVGARLGLSTGASLKMRRSLALFYVYEVLPAAATPEYPLAGQLYNAWLNQAREQYKFIEPGLGMWGRELAFGVWGAREHMAKTTDQLAAVCGWTPGPLENYIAGLGDLLPSTSVPRNGRVRLASISALVRSTH